MAYYFPQSLESFAKISGVGVQKLTTFGQKFLAIIRQHTTSKNLSERTIPIKREQSNSSNSRLIKRANSTYSQTKELVNQKLSIAEIAGERGMVESTIISHLEKIIQTGKYLNLKHLQPPKEELTEITKTFEEIGSTSLTPIFKKLNQKYSYEKLRIVRLILQNRSNFKLYQTKHPQIAS